MCNRKVRAVSEFWADLGLTLAAWMIVDPRTVGAVQAGLCRDTDT